MSRPTIGQVGLGQMGGNLARHLLDSEFDVVGFDVSEEACASFREYGGDVADSNADLASRADIVLTALQNPAIIEEAFFSSDGIVHGDFEELVCIEQSTVPPEAVSGLAEDVESHGITLCDCPFLGGPYHTRNGELVSPFGGPVSLYEDHDTQELLDTISKTHAFVGEVGNGKATKLVNNAISLGNTALAMEAMTLGLGYGLDPEQLYELLEFGGATSLMFRLHMPSVLEREFEPEFPLAYTQKDLRYALRAAEDLDYPMHITSTILQQYTAAAAKGHAAEDTRAIVKLFEEYIGETLEGEIERDGPDPLLAESG